MMTEDLNFTPPNPGTPYQKTRSLICYKPGFYLSYLKGYAQLKYRGLHKLFTSRQLGDELPVLRGNPVTL